ncbi:malto-oligosyltrehalose trehalohydrolase [Desulfonatronum parangueonense]
MMNAYGPSIEKNGVRFRLWAPGADQVDVVLKDQQRPDRRERMSPMEDGWHEVLVPEAGDGTLYNFLINEETLVPDPASRFQPEDVFGPSQVVDTAAFRWDNPNWKGLPWTDTVLYELHVGAFTPEGTYNGVRTRLNYLKNLGITAIELMPLADFPGGRGWGYDGVLPFAPDSNYGTPEELKWLIDEAHGLGIMVFLDVVYNHFGPEGNYLHLYAPDFFNPERHTPWGAAIDFSMPQVREFYIANAIYWLDTYRFDGLRFDAVHAIEDTGTPHILEEMAQRIRQALPRDRHVHLVLENDANQAHFLEQSETNRSGFYTAQWNDDIHHVCHVLATGEHHGYYTDFVEAPLDRLGRCLAEGFTYQGDPSAHRNGQTRGEPSAHLPPESFVAFLQNHDQIGNRARGERLSMLTTPDRRTTLASIILLSPQIPLLFMGEEWGTRRPFLYFCDFEGDLANAVRDGRRREFASFPEFSDPAMLEQIPDPTHPDTFKKTVLHWDEPVQPKYARWLDLNRKLLAVRRNRIQPLLPLIRPGEARWKILQNSVLLVQWPLRDNRSLALAANIGPRSLFIEPQDLESWNVDVKNIRIEELFASSNALLEQQERLTLGPWAVYWCTAER